MKKKILIVSTQTIGSYEDYFVKSFQKLDFEVDYINTSVLAKWIKKIFRPFSYILKYNFYKDFSTKIVLKRINSEFLKYYLKFRPDIIFVYNDSNLLPDTLTKMKNAGSKVVLILADNPMWINYRWWFTIDVLVANLIVVHDKEWIPWMKMLGQNNVHHIVGGGNNEVFYPINPNDNEKKMNKSDILFVGRNYGFNSEGIYRAKILNSLIDYDLRVYGNVEWLPLLTLYPSLKEKFVVKSLSSEELNIARNYTKVYLALSNSGLPSGLHLRIFDAALSGAFVITEYRREIDEAFPNEILESFKTINELQEKVNYYLIHENERKEKAYLLRNYVLEHYTIDKLTESISSLISHLFIE